MSDGAPLRIAVMNFTVDDNSYRSAVAAGDFTAALQARLAAEVSATWLEREQLAPAEQEFEISLSGLARNGIRTGRWLKSDLIVTGSFTSDQTNRALHVEAIDSDHADVLASADFSLPLPAKRPLTGLVDHLETMVPELKAFILRAIERRQAVAGRRTLALLLVDDNTQMQTGSDLEPTLTTALEGEIAKRNDLRLLRFQRANRARDEVELVLSGLVDDSTNTFRHVADFYVWGTIDRVLRLRPADEVRLSVWNGGEAVIEIVRGMTNSLQGLASDLAQAVIAHLTNGLPNAATDETRKRMAQTLWQRAHGKILAGHTFYPGTLEGRRNLFSLLKLLETACFLDPENREAQADRIVHRWGNPPYPISRNEDLWSRWRYTDALGRHVDRFGFELRKTNSAGAVKIENIAEYYLRSTRYLAEPMRYGNRTDEGFPLDVPTRVADIWTEQFFSEVVKRAIKVADRKELTLWVCETVNEALGESLWGVRPREKKQLIEGVWPHLVRHSMDGAELRLSAALPAAINKLYQDEGKPNEGDRLFALLKRRESKPVAPVVQSKQPDRRQSPQEPFVLSLPEWELGLPAVAGSSTVVAFPKDSAVQTVTSLAFDGKRLWIVSDGLRKTKLDASNELDKEFDPLKQDDVEFWSYDPSVGTLKSLRHLFTSNSLPVTVVARSTNVWVGTGEGIYRVEDGSVERVADTRALPAGSYATLQASTTRLVAARNSRELTSRGLTTAEWRSYSVPAPLNVAGESFRVAAWADNALVIASQMTILDLATGIASPVTNLVAGAMPRSIEAGACVADEHGFWVGGGSGLHRISDRGQVTSRWLPSRVTAKNPLYSQGNENAGGRPASMRLPFNEWRKLREWAVTNRQRGQFVRPLQPRTRISAPILLLASEGDFLWIVSGTTEFSLLLFHKPTEKWVGQFKLPAYAVQGVPAIALSPEFVWVGLSQSRYRLEPTPLLKIPKHLFLTRPKETWIEDRITSNDLAQVDGWKNSEQVIYHFFNGDDERVVQMMERVPLEQIDIQTLYVLGCTYDELGLNDPKKARLYFAEIVGREPDSPWGVQAQRLISILDIRTGEATRHRQYLARYDTNRDGKIDESESQRMRRDPQFIKDEQERVTAEKSQTDLEFEETVEAFVGRHDRDKNGRLDRFEFTTGMLRDRSLLGTDSGVPPPLLFDRYDTNRSQTLELGELRNLLKDLKTRDVGLSPRAGNTPPVR